RASPDTTTTGLPRFAGSTLLCPQPGSSGRNAGHAPATFVFIAIGSCRKCARAILRAAGKSPVQKPPPRPPACRSRARGHAPETGTRAQRLPLPVPAAGARRNVPEDQTIQMRRQFPVLDPQLLPRDRAPPRARSRPLSTSADSTRLDRREKAARGRRTFAPIACLPRRVHVRAG